MDQSITITVRYHALTGRPDRGPIWCRQADDTERECCRLGLDAAICRRSSGRAFSQMWRRPRTGPSPAWVSATGATVAGQPVSEAVITQGMSPLPPSALGQCACSRTARFTSAGPAAGLETPRWPRGLRPLDARDTI